MVYPLERERVWREVPELELDVQGLGRRIEERVLAGEKGLVMKEEERQQVRRRLIELGVNVGDLRKEGGKLREQTLEVSRLLGKDGLNNLINEVLPKVIHQKGGGVYKDSDVKAGLPEPSDERVVFFAHTIVDRFDGDDFVLEPVALSAGVQWREATIYRVEALISMAYQILRVCSYEGSQAAERYQWGNREMNKFRQRLIRGEIAHMGKDKAPSGLLALRSEEKNIRYSPTGTLGEILGALLR